MVPERQAFHPSQKAVKAVADSTVSRPRRSRAKYRDNKTVEVKPCRPARKRRCISRMDSLSDSKTSDGSDSCLEVPAGRGSKASGSLGSEVPGTRESQDAKSLGSAVPVTQGLSDPVSYGLPDPVTQGLSDPVTQGLSDPMSQGLSDPLSQGLSDPMIQGLSDPVTQELSDPMSQGLPDPVTQASDEPVSQRSGDTVSQSLEVLISEFKRKKVENRVTKPPKRQRKKKSDVKATPAKEPAFRSTNEPKHDFGGNERMLMRQWLEAEADGGRIPGLRWLDKPDGLIRINWRHGSRAEWSTGDVTVFKSWAQHTGRFNSKEPDYKRWKANFRCAVNSLHDVKEVKEKRGMKAGDPYKVYKLLPAILPKKRRRESVKSARSSSPENIPTAMEIETSIATDVVAAEPEKSEPPPVEPPLPPELFLQLMPLHSGAECEPVVAWSSGVDLDCIPTNGDMENLVTLDAPLMYVDHCYANRTDGGIVQRIPSLPPPPSSPPPPPAIPFNNAIPLPVQNLIDSEEEFQTMTSAPENLENLNEMNISELFSLPDLQAGSISSTNDSAFLLETFLQALLNQPGIIITSEAV